MSNVVKLERPALPAVRSKIVSYGLVRDSSGRPKIDDPWTVPLPIINMLTDDDWRNMSASMRAILEGRK